jgi:hypothetical protein
VCALPYWAFAILHVTHVTTVVESFAGISSMQIALSCIVACAYVFPRQLVSDHEWLPLLQLHDVCCATAYWALVNDVAIHEHQ